MRNLLIISVILNLVTVCLGHNGTVNTSAYVPDNYALSVKADSSSVTASLNKARKHLEACQYARFPKSHDSLKIYLDQAINLSKKSNFNKGLAQACLLYSEYYYQNFDDPRSKKYATQGLGIYQKLNYKPGIAEAYLKIARIYDGNSEAEHLKMAQKAKSIYKELNDKVNEGYAARIISELYRFIGDAPNAMKYVKESISTFNKGRYKGKEYANSLLQSGLIIDTGNLDQAFKYVMEASKVAEALPADQDVLANAYAHLGRLYTYTKNYETALFYLKKANDIAINLTDRHFLVMNRLSMIQVSLLMNRKEEAMGFAKGLDKYEDLDFETMVSLTARLILLFTETKRLDLAQKYVHKAGKIINSTSEGLIANRLNMPLARYYYVNKEYSLSQYYLERYKAWAKKADNNLMLLSVYRQQFRIDSARGDFKSAIKSLAMHQHYQDLMLNEDSQKRIDELKVQYDVLKKERDLKIQENANKLLVKQNELQQVKVSRSNLVRNISVAGTGMVIALLGLFYVRHKSNKRLNKLLRSQQEEIIQRNKTLQHLVGEKEWLLKEIHHRVKNNLHLIMSLLNGQLYFVDDKVAHSAIQKGLHRIQSMSLIHQKLYMADNLSAINMQDYINDLVEYLSDSLSNQKNVKFHLSVESVEMDVAQAVPVGLILNEAITNSIKYAFPDRKGNIRIYLNNTTGDTFSLEINDDGTGLPQEFDLGQVKSLGMKLIKGLSDDLDGTLVIESDKGGTRIRVEFTYRQLLSEHENYS